MDLSASRSGTALALACLHDAKLVELHSDGYKRTAILEFQSAHLSASAVDLHFILHMEGVSSLRATVWRDWPREFPASPSASRTEQSRLVEEYQRKGREETLSWPVLEASLRTQSLDVMDANYTSSDTQIALQINGFLVEDDVWCELFLRGGRLIVARSDGEPFSLEAFISLGENYWKEFAQRQSK